MIISSLFDPLGFVAPVTLSGKLLLQKLSTQKLDGDEKIPNEDATKCNRWIQDLSALMELFVSRFLFLQDGGINCAKSNQIHHFSSTSPVAYSVATYLRFVCHNDNVFLPFYFWQGKPFTD